ncbi:hypothetical protein NPIL_238291 [Nephila pilipes]|uniref:Uncharacterized protein n=1 Tax=Nephila pilipes TaxID=299642 RepID=A0A8X6U4Q6_NEPPI|nr:hypothetical protein NPIL_238291 [Nephila pilipes]
MPFPDFVDAVAPSPLSSVGCLDQSWRTAFLFLQFRPSPPLELPCGDSVTKDDGDILHVNDSSSRKNDDYSSEIDKQPHLHIFEGHRGNHFHLSDWRDVFLDLFHKE